MPRTTAPTSGSRVRSPRSEDPSLVLGWEMTPAGDPVYWLDPEAKPGRQRPDDLVKVSPREMSSHTVIVAQSGSGKSTFVGRLIEELLIRTKARCVVFDPNADFWKGHLVEETSLWDEASYDRRRGRGKLPHEANRLDFANRWAGIGKRILTARAMINPEAPYEQLRVWWPSLPVELFAEGLDPVERGEVYHRHAFVQAVARLRSQSRRKKREDLIDRAERLFHLGKADREDFRTSVQEEFFEDEPNPSDALASLYPALGPRLASSFASW